MGSYKLSNEATADLERIWLRGLRGCRSELSDTSPW